MQVLDRRCFLATAAGASCAVRSLVADEPRRIHIASQQYPWMTFFEREGKKWDADLPRSLSTFANSGVMGIEPILTSVAGTERLIPLVRDFRQDMRSVYMNRVLHDPTMADAQLSEALAVAEEVVRTGCRIMVVNPTPLRWGGDEEKTDAQLDVQAKHLSQLGKGLRDRGVTLAYHHHGVEMRRDAREVRRMLEGTDPDAVSFCLDAHWAFRGAGNSAAAVFDFARKYRDRIVELHLRQSRDGVWTETFGDGDIDYGRLAKLFAEANQFPHLVLEQAIEKGTPATLTATDAHRESVWQVRKVFAAWGT
jgi:inosose dehydratase